MTPRTDIYQIQAGDTFRVVRGSRAGALGVTGKADVATRDESTARIDLSVGKFGFNFDVLLELERIGDEVLVTASGRSFDTIEMRVEVVVERPTEIRLRDIDGNLKDTHLVVDADGRATLDAEIPTIGAIHLLLESR